MKILPKSIHRDTNGVIFFIPEEMYQQLSNQLCTNKNKLLLKPKIMMVCTVKSRIMSRTFHNGAIDVIVIVFVTAHRYRRTWVFHPSCDVCAAALFVVLVGIADVFIRKCTKVSPREYRLSGIPAAKFSAAIMYNKLHFCCNQHLS